MLFVVSFSGLRANKSFQLTTILFQAFSFYDLRARLQIVSEVNTGAVPLSIDFTFIQIITMIVIIIVVVSKF